MSAKTATLTTPASRLLSYLMLAGIAVVAILLRIPGYGRDLWEDEIIAATHAEQPFWRLPVEVARYDVHPLLYFLQLHAWSLLGDSDLWLRLNSMFWDLVAIASMFVVMRRLQGERPAWVATALFAVSAPMVWMAQELRPYCWIYCLLLGAFYFLEFGFSAVSGRIRYKLAACCFCLGLIYSHAIGCFVVFLLGLYTLGRIVENGATRRAMAHWVVLFGLCAIAAGPPLLIGLMRDANLAASHGVFADLADWVPRLLLPRGNQLAMIILSAIVFIGIVGCGVAVRETRLMTCVLVLLPVLLAALLNALHVQLFKLNVFSTFVTPFLVIVAARLATRRPGVQGWAGAGLIGMVFVAFSILFILDRTPTTGFRAAAALIRADGKAGDIVYVPQQFMFWGMARYMGPDRPGWQLAVAPPLSEPWQRVYGRLGPWFVATFDLMPLTQTLPTQSGPPLVVGNDAIKQVAQAPRVWLITYKRADLPPGFPPQQIGPRKPVKNWTIGFLDLRLYQ